MLLYQKALWYFTDTSWLLHDILDALMTQYQIVYKEAIQTIVWAMGEYYGCEKPYEVVQ